MHTLMRSFKYACVAMLLGPGLSLATATAANALSDAKEPGSLIIFPYFTTGTVTPDNAVQPKTEIHIGVTCPVGVTCPEGEPVKLEAHWVCPGSENPSTSFVCKESNFVLFTTVNGKITVNPNGQSSVGNIPPPPCRHGYLIAWVINTLDQPIKFDGLFGDAVVRNSSSAESAYDGIPVQAADTVPADTGKLITTGLDLNTGEPTLIFDGVAPHYTMLTGQLTGDVKFTNDVTTPGTVDPNTALVFLTVDVQSNFPNNPTFVPLTFYNAKEVPTSTSFNFVCWGAVQITKLNASLTQTAQGTPEGSFASGQAVKVQISGISDSSGPATLLGLVITTESSAPKTIEREYITQPFNNSVGIPTAFGFD
jgi:hypothetical protein